MKKIYEKDEMTFTIICIVIYCILQSLANPLNDMIHIDYFASAVFCILQAIILFNFIRKNRLTKHYGLCKSPVPARQFLYYVPLAVLSTTNLWNGIAFNYSFADTVCRIVCMLCVGFVEEMLFRGFLFKALAKDNMRTAVIISSITFGLGHFLNMINGSGMDFSANLFQVVSAIAFGFLFVIIFYRGGTLLPCIVTHSAFNTISTFADGTGLTPEKQIVFNLIMLILIVSYTLILTRTLPQVQRSA